MAKLDMHIVSNFNVGDPVSFTMTVTPKKNLPLDLYILIDLSNSMREELAAMTRVSGEIGEKSILPLEI